MKNGLSVERTLTYSDAARLRQLLKHEPEVDCETLVGLLDTSDVVPSNGVPGNLVTMGSTVLLQHVENPSSQLLTLSYPEQADPGQGRVSILSPIGSAVYGLEAGATASWTTPDHRPHSARIVEVVYQPEASGDLQP